MKNMINEKEVKTFLKKSYKYPLSISKKAKMQIDNNVRFVTRIKSIGKNGMLKILGLGFDRKWFQMSLGVIASVLVLIGSFWIFSNINGDKENVNKVKAEIFVTSTSASSLGITEQSGFVVKVGADVSSEKIAENIEIYPPIEYKVEIENGTLSVIPNDNLLPDTIYSIKLAQGTELSEGSVLEDEMLWMFVTEPTLNLITTYPLDLSTNVAVSDEIVFEFSRFDLDLQSFEDNFTITPDVEGKFYKLGNKIKFVPNESLIGGISYEVRLNKDFSTNSGKSLQEETVITFVTDSNGNKDNVYVNLNDGCFSNLNNSDLSISFVNNYSTCVISSNTGRINVKAYELPTSLLGDLTEYALLVNNLEGSDELQLSRYDLLWSDEYMFEEGSDYTVFASNFNTEVALIQYEWSLGTIVESRFELLFFEDEKVEVEVNSLGYVSVNYYDAEFDSKLFLFDKNLNKVAEYDENTFDLVCNDCVYFGYVENGKWYIGNIIFLHGVDTTFITNKPYYSVGEKVEFAGVLNNVGDVDEITLFAEYVKDDVKIPLLEEKIIFDNEFNFLSGSFLLPKTFSGELICSLYYGEIFLFEHSLVVGAELQNINKVSVDEDFVTDDFFANDYSVLGLSDSYLGGQEVNVGFEVSDAKDNRFEGNMLVKIVDKNNSSIFWDTKVFVEDGVGEIKLNLPYFAGKCSVVFWGYDKEGNVWSDSGEFEVIRNIDIDIFVPTSVERSSVNRINFDLNNKTKNKLGGSLLVTANGACSLVSEEEITFDLLSAEKRSNFIEIIFEDKGSCDLTLTLKDGLKSTLIGEYVINIKNYEFKAQEIIKLQPNESHSFTLDSEMLNILQVSASPSYLYNSLSDINSTESAIKYLLFASLSENNNQFVDEALRILYEDREINACVNYDSDVMCDFEVVIMAKIATSFIKSRGFSVWTEWENRLGNYLEGLLYDETLSRDFKFMIVWALSFDKNNRGLANAIYLYENEKDLDILDLTYLLLTFENYSLKSYTDIIFGRIISMQIDGNNLDQVARYVNSVVLLGERIVKYIDFEIIEDNYLGIDSLFNYSEIWAVVLNHDIFEENARYSVDVDGQFIDDYEKGEKAELIFEADNPEKEHEITLKNIGSDMLVLYIKK